MPDGLLAGVRVLDLTTVLAGPFASMLLADIGAEVIKIERPPDGDEMRYMPPYFYKGESAYFLSVNRNKQSMVLDLKHPKGKEVFLDLVRRSDIVFDNARAGVVDRLGIGYAQLRTVNPRIICCSLSGYGQDSPYRDRPSYDLVIQGLSGAMSLTGEPGRPPVRLGISMGDLSGAMYAAFAMVNALYHRERTGEGQLVDIALLDSLVSLLTYLSQNYWIGGVVPQPVGSGHVTSVPYQAFPTRDGHMVLDAHSQKHWRALCQALGHPDMADDPRYATLNDRRENKEELVDWLTRLFATRPTDEWLELMHAAEVPAAPINRVDQVLQDPSVLARNMVVTMEHALGGEIKALGSPVHMSAMPEGRYQSPPLLGQHTVEILRNVLEYDDAEIAAALADGAVHGQQLSTGR